MLSINNTEYLQAFLTKEFTDFKRKKRDERDALRKDGIICSDCLWTDAALQDLVFLA